MVIEFYNPLSLRYLSTKIAGPRKTGHIVKESDVPTRWDVPWKLASYLPPEVELKAKRGVRVVTLAASSHSLPVIGAAIGSLLSGAADPDFSFAITWPDHGWLLTLALVAQVAGWLLITSALPRLPALETSVMLLLQPMLTVLWGFLLFAEHLSAAQWAGVALVLGGVGALTLRGSVERPVEAPAEA